MIHEIKATLKDYNAQLVAVSKKRTVEAILEKYKEGQRVFGENRVQELMDKKDQLPDDIEWHLIGHLQRNKVRYIAPFVQLIHSIDNAKLLKEVDVQAAKQQRSINILLQFKIAKEESKYGLTLDEAKSILEQKAQFQHVSFHGVMGMATFTDDEATLRNEFKQLKNIFDQLKDRYFSQDNHFSEISMGMSNDFKIAIEEGSTMVRIGSLLFN